jgi:DNA primase
MDTSSINLVEYIGKDVPLKRVANTGGGEWHGPCPFCGGHDRFVVQPFKSNGGRFWCRRCNASGDIITYIEKCRGLNFTEACDYLQLHRDWKPSASVQAPLQDQAGSLLMPLGTVPALSDVAWQTAAKAFCRSAIYSLLSAEGRVAREFLYMRGFTDETIRHAYLGYNPRFHEAHWGDTDVKLSTGIVIPWYIQGNIWRVKLRRLGNEKPKYIQAAGGANGLYLADDIRAETEIVLTEGELDALSIRQVVAADKPTHIAVSTGSKNGAQRAYWLLQVSRAKRVLLAFDNDEGGDEAAAWWKTCLDKMAVENHRLRPVQKDVNEMLMLNQNISAWLSQGTNLNVNPS